MKTEIYNLIILDKSGSMNTVRNSAVGGVNETIGSIQADARKTEGNQDQFISLYTFCSCSAGYVFADVPALSANKITLADYEPCCGTPLYDAIGTAVNDLYSKIKGKPGAIAQVTIITDGMENSSREYDLKAVRALIEQRKDNGWLFAFIGANIDVNAVSQKLAIDNSLEFTADEAGTAEMFKTQNFARSKWSENIMACLMDDNKDELKELNKKYFKKG